MRFVYNTFTISCYAEILIVVADQLTAYLIEPHGQIFSHIICSKTKIEP